MNTIEGLFGQHAQNIGQDVNSGQVLSSSQDPYGDPTDRR